MTVIQYERVQCPHCSETTPIVENLGIYGVHTDPRTDAVCELSFEPVRA